MKRIPRQSIYKRPFLVGVLTNLVSAVLFYAATLLVHLGSHVSALPSFHYALVRYTLGAFLFGFLVFRDGNYIKQPLSLFQTLNKFIVMRALFNFIAVILFYQGVMYGITSRANVMNMTYPAFVALFAPFVIQENMSWKKLLLVGLAMVGVAFNFYEPFRDGRGVLVGDLFGLGSGIVAGLAIVTLRGAAQKSSTEIILFWMFTLGTIATFPLSLTGWSQWNVEVTYWVIGSALCGVLGQWLLTFSYKFLEATYGSIISSSRIPISILAGFLFLNESFEPLSWFGGGIILISNLLLAIPDKSEK